MKLLEQEFFSIGHVTAIGMRKQLWGEPKKKWGVYVRLSSGSVIELSKEGSKKEARAYAKQMAANIHSATGCAFARCDDGEVMLVLDAITRAYVDTNQNGYIVLVEDIGMNTYTIERGNKERCQEVMVGVATTIMQYQAMRGGGIVPGREDTKDD